MTQHFQNGGRQAEAVPELQESVIKLGTAPATGEAVELSYQDLTGTHTQIVGSSGTGKSYGILQLEQEFLKQQPQIAFAGLEPEGHLHGQLMNFLAHNPELATKVILFDLSDPGGKWPGLNPLCIFGWSPQVSVLVLHIISAFAKIWAEESKNTPLLRRMLRNILFPLIEGRFSIMEAEYFLDLAASGVRRKLAKMTTNRRVQRDWLYFDKLTPTRKLEQLGSASNRLAEFTDAKVFHLVLGRTGGNVLDIGRVMDEGRILLVNLSQRGGWLSADDAYLIGALLISLFVAYALTRSEEDGKRKPYILIADEYQSILTSDAAKILDQCRKRGLHFVFGHQHMSQIEEQDPWLASSVLQNSRTKMVFSMDNPSDLATFEEYLFTGEHDLQRVKHQSYSGQEAVTPAFWPLPELRYRNQTKIHKLPKQHMYLKREGKPPQLVRVQDVELFPHDESKLQSLRELIWANNPGLYMTEEEIMTEQEARRQELEQRSDTEDDDYLDTDD